MGGKERLDIDVYEVKKHLGVIRTTFRFPLSWLTEICSVPQPTMMADEGGRPEGL
jgi:hypothetical protein